jgi:oligosaccharide repeat unit polymerase
MTLSLYASNVIPIYPLHLPVLFMVDLGSVLFSIAGIAAWLVPSTLVTTRLYLWPNSPRPSHTHWLKYMILALGLISMLISLKNILALGAGAEGATFLARARNAGVDAQNSNAGGGSGLPGFSLGSYIPELTIFAAVMFFIERRDRIAWCMTAVALGIAILTTGRVNLLQLFLGLTCVHLMKSGKTRFTTALRFIRVPFLCFMGLYVGLIFTNKDTSTIKGGISGIALYFVVSYIIGPVAALDQVWEQHGLFLEQTNHTMKFFLGVMAKAHLIVYTPPPTYDQFVAVPFPANVYTGYKYFFVDYGWTGVVVAVCIIGFFHTLLYRKAKDGNSELGLFCFAMSMFPLVMFIFDDLYSAPGTDFIILTFGSLYLTVRPLRFLPQSAPAPKLRLLPSAIRREV